MVARYRIAGRRVSVELDQAELHLLLEAVGAFPLRPEGDTLKAKLRGGLAELAGDTKEQRAHGT